MPRFALPILIALAALLLGIGIGRYRPASTADNSVRTNPPGTSLASSATDPANPPVVSSNQNPASSKQHPSSTASSEEIIAQIKSALTRSASRHTYATFSKLSETV